MSRAGKHEIDVTAGVSVSKLTDKIVVKGTKGELSVRTDTANAHLVNVDVLDRTVVVSPVNKDNIACRAMWGTMARNIKQAIEGVSKGFAKEMGMKGVGYKATVKGSDLVLTAGYSHDVVLAIPAGLAVDVSTPTEFVIKGIDKNMVGTFADRVRKVRRPEPYKGKGIFYKAEKIRRKEGKKK